jgi:cob(I)alamin adenosyltransferase
MHDNSEEERSRVRAERKRALVEDAVAAARSERGVLLVHTGNGKGKSSAAFGLVARALGHGLTPVVVQFVKSRTDTGEEVFFRAFPGLRWHVMGAGFTWETQDRQRDTAAAQAAWVVAMACLSDPAVDLVVLDEMTYAFTERWLELDEVLAALRARPPMQHVVITGRGAPRALVEAADTVTEMTLVKHAFSSGVKAMRGVEW